MFPGLEGLPRQGFLKVLKERQKYWLPQNGARDKIIRINNRQIKTKKCLGRKKLKGNTWESTGF